MNADLVHELARRFGPVAVRLVRVAPLAWRSTPRRRRLLFLVVCSPGFGAVAALPTHKSLWLLLAGTAWIIAAAGLRASSEPTLISGDARD